MASILDTAGDIFGAVQSGVGMAAPYANLALAEAKAASQKAAAYYEQGLMEVKAIDTLSLAQIRTDQEQRYAAIQAGRRMQQAELEARNYQAAGNSLLRKMEQTNAAVRARAAANGVAVGEGSAAAVQRGNVAATYRDVGVTDLNALAARIFGYEDAGAMMLAAKQSADYTMTAAERQAAQYRLAGDFAVRSGGLLSAATMTAGVIDFAKTATNPFKP